MESNSWQPKMMDEFAKSIMRAKLAWRHGGTSESATPQPSGSPSQSEEKSESSTTSKLREKASHTTPRPYRSSLTSTLLTTLLTISKCASWALEGLGGRLLSLSDWCFRLSQSLALRMALRQLEQFSHDAGSIGRSAKED